MNRKRIERLARMFIGLNNAESKTDLNDMLLDEDRPYLDQTWTKVKVLRSVEEDIDQLLGGK